MKWEARLGDQNHKITITKDEGIYHVNVDGKDHEVDVRKLEGDFYTMLMDGKSYEVSVERNGDKYLVRHQAAVQTLEFSDPSQAGRQAGRGMAGPAPVEAAMPGKVVRVLVAVGDKVEEGQGVLVLEAMKMENEIAAPKSGVIKTLDVQEGAAVEAGARLCLIE